MVFLDMAPERKTRLAGAAQQASEVL